MEINGIPLHPLVVHATVVLVPLAALAGILMSFPRWRWLVRWPALLLTLGGAAAAWVAKLTGENLEETRHLESPLVRTHAMWADRLVVAMAAFALVVIVAFWALPHVSRLVGGGDRAARVGALEKPLMIVVPVVAVVVLVLVVVTGDAGARAVWSGG